VDLHTDYGGFMRDYRIPDIRSPGLNAVFDNAMANEYGAEDRRKRENRQYLRIKIT